ncbi:MAG: VWA domain-containing protein [Bacteroidetes bacterium]|nr:VWA domain-containing protein [Bacteroidota bacterium]
MYRKIFFIFLLTFFAIKSSFAQNNIEVSPKIYDFGIVAKWKNDTAVFELKNNSESSMMFLPIGYTEDLLVIAPRNKIEPGETTLIKIVYYTHSRGNFRRDVPVYLSILPKPILLVIKGKIIDFHPDALMNCPSMGDDKPKSKETGVEIEVKDGITGKSLSGFNLILKNNSESRLIEVSPSSKVKFEHVRNGDYTITVSLSGYETKVQEVTVSKYYRKFVVKLIPEDEPLITQNEKDTFGTSEEIIIEKEKSNDKDDIEKLRKKYDSLYKGKKIIEKDVILIKPGEEDSLSIDTAGFESDFDNEGKLNKKKYANNNIVFLIDVSGSMDKPEKLPLLKKSVIEMVKILRENDYVTIITYSSKVKVVLESESGNNKEKIYSIINSLQAKGQSYGSEGMKVAYEAAMRNFILNGNNQVILVSDGLFNSDDFSPKKIYKLTKDYAKNQKIITSAIGFGKNDEAIEFLKNVAKNGLGNFIVIKTESQASDALVYEIMQNSLKK